MVENRTHARLQTTFLNPKELLKHIGIEQGMTVADLGFGSGYFSFAAAELVSTNGTVYAVDVNKAALSHLKSRINLTGQRNIVPIWADIEQLGKTGIPEGTCDAVFLVKVLYQLEHRTKGIAEAARILRPKGTLLVVEWKKAKTSIGPDIRQRIDLRDVEREITPFGFTVSERPDVDEQHSVMVLTKL